MIEDSPQTAWDRSAALDWQGQPVTWAYRQRYFWLAVARYGAFAAELDWLLAMWIGQLDKRGLRNAEREWRQDKDALIDKFLDFADQFPENGDEVKEAGVRFAEIWEDEDASRDEIEGAEEAADDAGTPKKSATQPIMSAECEPSPA